MYDVIGQIKVVQGDPQHERENADESFFKRCYNYACSMAELVGIVPSLASRQMHLENAEADTPEDYYRRNACLPFLDHLIQGIDSRFVLLRFQKHLRPHLSFSYRIVFTRPQYNAILETHGRVIWRPVVSIMMTSPFTDSIVFSVHTENTVFKKYRFKSLHSGERFRMAPFSVIVFGVVEWTIAVSGAKQLRFRLKTD